MIQNNQNLLELITRSCKGTKTHSFGSSTSTIKIHASDTSVKSNISLAQKMPLMKQQLLPYLSLKKHQLFTYHWLWNKENEVLCSVLSP